VNAVLDRFESAGFHVRAVDVRSWALARAGRASCQEGITAVLDIGWNGASVVLIHHGEPIYQRELTDAGEGLLRRSLIAELGLGVRPLRPADVAACPPHLADAGANPAMTLAMGLAMYPES